MSANEKVVSITTDKGGLTLEQKKARMAELLAAQKELRSLQNELGELNAGQIESSRFAIFAIRTAREFFDKREKEFYDQIQSLTPGMSRITFRETGDERKKYQARYDRLLKEHKGDIIALVNSL